MPHPRLSVDACPRVRACWAAAHLDFGLVSRHVSSRLVAPIGTAQCLLTLFRRSPPLLHPARASELSSHTSCGALVLYVWGFGVISLGFISEGYSVVRLVPALSCFSWLDGAGEGSAPQWWESPRTEGLRTGSVSYVCLRPDHKTLVPRPEFTLCQRLRCDLRRCPDIYLYVLAPLFA